MADTPVVIERDKPREPAFDYEQLRREAIAHVQRLSGKIWTDYNLHDPGVTILEQLCYAITDLAYRTDFPIDEILADKKGDIDPLLHAFFSKGAIMSTSPITINDYRKLVIDEVDEVENIWIEPVQGRQFYACTRGLYRVFVQLEDAMVDAKPEVRRAVMERVYNCLMSYRNIGEDLEEILSLTPQAMAVKAEIQVDGRYQAQEIAAHVCHAFELAMHPPVRFFTEAELANQGYAVEDIYSGPLLKKGFIIDSDLSERKTMVDPADLLKAVADVPGVLKVKSLSIAGEDGVFTSRPIQVKEGHFPLLQVPGEKNDIRISSDKYEYLLRDVVFWNAYQKAKIIGRRKFVGQKTGEAHPPLKAAYRNISRYYSLQHHFPGIYGIGPQGLESSAPARRKAQAKQLKAYLLFFEQLLANYLAQLGSMGNFFSPLAGNTPPYTYSAQPLYNVPDVQPLLRAFTEEALPAGSSWEQFIQDTGNSYAKALLGEHESDKVYQERKNRILDHLLARFNLFLISYPVALYKHVYHEQDVEPRVNMELEWKADILRHVVRLTGNRIRSFNYREDLLDPGTLSGYERWTHKLLYIPNEKRKRLSAVFDAEHVRVNVSRRQPGHVQSHFVKEYRLKDEVLRVAIDEAPDADQPIQYNFAGQPVAFLRTGLSMDNYRIVYDEETREHLVVYRHVHHEAWKIVLRAGTRDRAAAALEDMIRHLKQISMDSEGFYLVEHLLLKPGLKESAFGFRMYDRDGRMLREHPYWCTFEEREAQLQKLQQEAERQQAYFEYYIRHQDGRMLPENFFRFGLTIVLPIWPARFQLQEFRQFAEGLFRERTPAQLRLQFKWLGIAAMRTFEGHYFSWLKAMQDNQDVHAAVQPLIGYLANDQLTW
jgi:hypothetical protein